MIEINAPTPEQAEQFAQMICCGMPPLEAILYFLPESNEEPPNNDIIALAKKWQGSKRVARAVEKLSGGPWQGLDPEARLNLAIEKQYNEMAYFLYSRNYVELKGAERAKADTCRDAIERKMAGMAGKMDALNRFYADITSGKVALNKISLPVN